MCTSTPQPRSPRARVSTRRQLRAHSDNTHKMAHFTWSTSSRLNTAGVARARFSAHTRQPYSQSLHQHHLRSISSRQRTWPQALHRMARFVGHCEALRARRAGDVVADRGARWYKAVAHHLKRVLRAWRRRCFVFRFLRLLDAWHLRHAILKWRNGVRILTDGERTIAQVLLLWRFGWQRAAFLRWHMATDARPAISRLAETLRRANLGMAWRYWTQKTPRRAVCSQPRAPRHVRLAPRCCRSTASAGSPSARPSRAPRP